MKSYKPYSHICQVLLRVFIKEPDKTFPNLVREFYSNLQMVRTSLRSSLKGVSIDIHKDHIDRIFELPFQGSSYKYETPLGSKSFKRSIALNNIVVNPMEKSHFPRKSNILKPKFCIIHYLLTKILLSKSLNLNYVIRDDVVPLWILT